ncbi:MAG: DUF1902 domain-containing protein [Caulobacterales bacterium]
MRKSFTVVAAWDSAAKTWFVHHTDIPGLNVEAPDLAAFEKIVRQVGDELIRANVPDAGACPAILVSSLA